MLPFSTSDTNPTDKKKAPFLSVKKLLPRVRGIFIYIHTFLFFERFVNNTAPRGKSTDGTRTRRDVNNRFHEIGVTFGYYVARAIERYVRGRYLEVDAAERASKRTSEICEFQTSGTVETAGNSQARGAF